MATKLLTGKLSFKSNRPLDLSRCTKDEIRTYFENSYDLNESVFVGLKDPKSIFKCPDRLRLPLVFYYTHTSAVYVNKLLLAGLIKERVNPDYETMFETGVDEMSWDDTENYRMGGEYKWPSVDDIVAYRLKVRNIILQVIEDTPLELPITMESPWWALLMGFEHERIHLETSSVLLRQMPVELMVKPKAWKYAPYTCESPPKKNTMLPIEGGVVTMGKPRDFPSYGWDNEYGEVTCSVPAFEASRYPVTNGEFMAFVHDDGYSKRELWSDEGWKWVNYRQAHHPTFWVCDKGCKGGSGGDLKDYSPCQPRLFNANNINSNNNQNNINNQNNGHSNGHNNAVNGSMQNGKPAFRYRAMYDVMEMPMEWPVEVNYHEAKAYCKWKGPDFRVPGEAEYHVMRGEQLPVTLGTKSDPIYQDNIEVNFNLRYGSSTPVQMFPPTEAGLHDVTGNVWQWTEDHFNGLTPDFATHHLYDDFSSPCFDGKHNVMHGGSWISTGDEASRFARFAFRRHFFQHLGFRMARSPGNNGRQRLPIRNVTTDIYVLGQGKLDKSPTFEAMEVEEVPTTNTHYSLDATLPMSGILELEFGFRDSLAAKAAARAASLAKKHYVKCDTAMYVGTGTGRAAFELSKTCNTVLGVDICTRLIDAALQLQKGATLTYGDGKDVTLDPDTRPERVTFKQLTWLPNEVNNHSLVVLSLLERVQNPKAWLVRLWEVTANNGMAVVVSPDGAWNKERLIGTLRDRLTCVASESLSYTSTSGDSSATLTVWKHK